MEDDQIERITEWPVTVNLSNIGENNSELQYEDQSSNLACSPLRKKKKIENSQPTFPRTTTHGIPNCPEALASVRVARWWRKQNLCMDPTAATSPNTKLYKVLRTTECIDFLVGERTKLLRQKEKLSSHERGDIHAALASIEDWLENYPTALLHIEHAVSINPNNSEYMWLKEKLKRQCDILKIQMEILNTGECIPKEFPAFFEVERISSADLSVEEIVNNFIMRKKPVIITGLEMTKSSWNLDFVKSVAGTHKVKVKCAVSDSVEWARLEESSLTTVGEFISKVEKNETNEYLFDWSLPLHCPELAQDLVIPKYFADNFLHVTAPGTLYHDSWPSLFISPKGALSNLHVDAFASNFWMVLFQGQKRWTFFDSEDLPLLYPHYFHSMDPVFKVNLAHPDLASFPLLGLTKPRQCVLQPGELLFVPGGSPHYVENLSATLAVSSNHVDHSNFKEVCEELRINGLIDPRAADLLNQLQNLIKDSD
ncbi:uncharacterized protein LOC131938068 [Physella acuta]|uniref:uncharacterized protein LOC131938068 n=1 Tax=Physella acuta TaxID=109671 RepID=UPI0027DE92AC|nr:uncharacterized protein LOC131938068 [Physella acuta]XP_059151941.1 uncharacterized protein LOC131938068 [Physella acuta]XP_059151942.1 uncharacterized protein LOC131938068 [Physella acuta]